MVASTKIAARDVLCVAVVLSVIFSLQKHGGLPFWGNLGLHSLSCPAPLALEKDRHVHVSVQRIKRGVTTVALKIFTVHPTLLYTVPIFYQGQNGSTVGRSLAYIPCAEYDSHTFALLFAPERTPRRSASLIPEAPFAT